MRSKRKSTHIFGSSDPASDGRSATAKALALACHSTPAPGVGRIVQHFPEGRAPLGTRKRQGQRFRFDKDRTSKATSTSDADPPGPPCGGGRKSHLQAGFHFLLAPTTEQRLGRGRIAIKHENPVLPLHRRVKALESCGAISTRSTSAGPCETDLCHGHRWADAGSDILNSGDYRTRFRGLKDATGWNEPAASHRMAGSMRYSVFGARRRARRRSSASHHGH